MNTFGSTTRQFPLLDLRSVLANRARFRRELLSSLYRVNHFYCPYGHFPFRGWLLLDRYSYNQLNLYSTTLTLNIGDTTRSTNLATLRNLSIVSAQCVTRGLSTDPAAIYLVELTDARGILHNRWFQAPMIKAYNIRAQAYPQTFQTSSLNSGTTWTWTTMLQDMWQQINTSNSNILGTWPGLPYAPAGTPEGFWMIGVPAWPALNNILSYLGMTVVCNLTSSTPYTIINDGASDPTFTALQSTYLTNLEEDLEPIDTGSGRVPLNVTILFRRRNSVYGSEETVRYDSLQWDMTPYYSVTLRAPAFFTSPVGTHFIWSDFTVRYDQDNNPLTADTTTALAIATERVTQYYARIFSGTSGTMEQRYAGALPFSTGAQVDGVCWYMDPEGDGAWRTKLARTGGGPPFAGVWDKEDV